MSTAAKARCPLHRAFPFPPISGPFGPPLRVPLLLPEAALASEYPGMAQIETPPRNYEVELVELPRQPYVAVRATIRMSEIGERMGGFFEQLYGWLAMHQVPPTGEPWTRYLAVGQTDVELEVAAPVAAPVAVNGSVISGVRPAISAARTLHVGPYEAMEGAYTAVMEWVTAQGKAVTGAMWEVYESDPQIEPNPARWRTWVYYPV